MERENLCCNVFLKMAVNFKWYSLGGGVNKKLAMPNIEKDGVGYRVNYCPSCGKEVRSIELKPEQLK